MKRKRLNITRRAGRFYFRRETRRLHDGTPDGEVLWIMNSNRKPRRVVPIHMFDRPLNHGRCYCVLVGTYQLPRSIRETIDIVRDYLNT